MSLKKFTITIAMLFIAKSYSCDGIIHPREIIKENNDASIKHSADFILFPMQCINLEKDKSITVIPYISTHTNDNSPLLKYKLYLHQKNKIIKTINSPKKSISIDAIYPTAIQGEVIYTASKKIISIATRLQNDSQANSLEQKIADLYEINGNTVTPIITGMIEYESISTFTTFGHYEKTLKQQPMFKIDHANNELSIIILQTIENIQCKAEKCTKTAKKKEKIIPLNYKKPNLKTKNRIIRIYGNQ